jgi:hypothetical protein
MTPQQQLEQIMKALAHVLASAQSHIATVSELRRHKLIELGEWHVIHFALLEEAERAIELQHAPLTAGLSKDALTLQTAHLQTCQEIVQLMETAKARKNGTR